MSKRKGKLHEIGVVLVAGYTGREPTKAWLRRVETDIKKQWLEVNGWETCHVVAVEIPE